MQDQCSARSPRLSSIDEAEQPTVESAHCVRGFSLIGQSGHAVIGIFLLSLAAAFFFAKTFLLPIIIAVLLALVLSPIVALACKEGCPRRPASPFMLMLAAVAVIFASIYFLSGPVPNGSATSHKIRYELEIKSGPELRGANGSSGRSDPGTGRDDRVPRPTRPPVPWL